MIKIIIQVILEFISTWTPATPPGLNSKGQPVRIKRIEDIKLWEQLRLRAYKPTPHDRWTIGYGHTGEDVNEGLEITEGRAESLLREDLAWVRKAIVELVDVPLSQEQYDALASLIFNIGRTNCASSTLLRKLNAYDMVGAAEEFPRWNKQRQFGRLVVLKGLTRRRAHERELFLDGTH